VITKQDRWVYSGYSGLQTYKDLVIDPKIADFVLCRKTCYMLYTLVINEEEMEFIVQTIHTMF